MAGFTGPQSTGPVPSAASLANASRSGIGGGIRQAGAAIAGKLKEYNEQQKEYKQALPRAKNIVNMAKDAGLIPAPKADEINARLDDEDTPLSKRGSYAEGIEKDMLQTIQLGQQAKRNQAEIERKKAITQREQSEAGSEFNAARSQAQLGLSRLKEVNPEAYETLNRQVQETFPVGPDGKPDVAAATPYLLDVAKRASKIVDEGKERIEIVPQTGKARIINEVDQTVKEVPIGSLTPKQKETAEEQPSGDQAAEEIIPEGYSLYDMAEFASGPKSKVQSILNVPKSWAGMDIDEQTLKARQAFKLSGRDLIRSLSVNPRFPVAEMEWIKEEVDVEPKFFDSPELLTKRLNGLQQYLEERRKNALEDARNPNLPLETQASQAQNASAISNYLGLLGDRDDATQKGRKANPKEADIPEGVDLSEQERELWPYLTEEEKDLWLKD